MTTATIAWLSSMLVAATPAEEIHAVTVAKPANSPTSSFNAIAMMPLSSLGSTDETVDAIQRVLLGEMRQLLGDRLIEPDDLLDQEEAARTAFYSCEGVVACLVEVIGGLGWDAFIVGNVAGLGERRVINLKIIDVRTGREVRGTREKAVGDEAQLIVNMRKAAVQLVAPEMFTGTIELLTKQTGVQILLDGTLVGATPLESPRLEVPAGRHAIEARGEGLVPFSTMAEVRYGEVKKVTVNLARSTVFLGGDTPFRHRWWTWAMAGAGLIGVGLGGYFNSLHVDAVERIEKRAARNGGGVDSADLQTEQEAHWNRAVIFYGVGGALTAGAGILLTLDFF